MSGPHDSFFKAVFLRPEEATGVLKAVLPPALVAQLDLASARLYREGVVDERLRSRQSDLVYLVNLAGRETLVYVLWEHESTQDPLMPLRLLIYMGRLWDEWLREEERRRKERLDHRAVERVPAILPVVLYQGPDRWEVATSLLDVIDLPPDLLAAVRPHLPSFRFVLDDLSQQDDAALRRREAGPFGTLALLLMRHARDRADAFLAALADCVDLLNSLPDEWARVAVLSYILEVADVSAEALAAALGPATRDVREAVVTAAEKLRTEGKAEGKAEGKVEGELKRSREILLRQLRVKFGRDLPAEVEQRVGAASLPQLDAWLERILAAATLDDVFASA